MAQRGLVVASQAAMERAEASRTKAQQRAWDAIAKQLLHVPAKRFATPEAAPAALRARSTAWRSPQLATSRGRAPKRSAGTGRPPTTSPLKAIAWQIHAQIRPAQEVREAHKPLRACFVMGTHIPTAHRTDAEVLRAYKAPAGGEGGGRFLKAPLFFVSALFVKKPSRMQGLLMVLTLALLVESLTQAALASATHRAPCHDTESNPPTD